MNTSRVPFDITLASGVEVTRREVENSRVFQQWLKQLEKTGGEITVLGVEVLAAHVWGQPPEIKMIHMVVDAVDDEGRKIPGIVTLRGETADVLAVLNPSSGAPFVVFVVQPRVPGAQWRVVSNVSGMVDAGETTAVAGLRELDEELTNDYDKSDPDDNGGIVWGEYIDLTPNVIGSDDPLLVSPGGSDEAVKFFVRTGKVTPNQLSRLRFKFTGVDDENIQLMVVPLADAMTRLTLNGGRVCMKTLLSLMLYQEHLRRTEPSKHLKGAE